MKRNVRIEIRNEKESAQDFVNAWHRAQKGMAPEQPVDRIYFKDLNTLLRVLTPRRMEAIKAVHDNGPVSFRALAKFLGRDYKRHAGDGEDRHRSSGQKRPSGSAVAKDNCGTCPRGIRQG